ncbi:GH25 family lysozyme [Brevibacillus laterosporus]|uniref:glycoside hydrolase family 25 protein n=1 Tax=Brevibacillus laterosporus TaxID=1465 RepID=UPI003D1E3BFD
MKYAFIKATEGTSLVDKKLKENAQGANRAGIKVGYYHFAHPDLSAQVQAEHFVQTVKGLPCDMPLVLDIETDKGLTPAQITAFCLTFLTHVKGHTGKTPMIYTGAYFAKRNLGKALAGFPLWVAKLQYKPTYAKSYMGLAGRSFGIPIVGKWLVLKVTWT